MRDKEYYAHETSLIGKDASIGKNTRIWQFCNIMSGAIIGDDCNIGQGVFVEAGVKLGNNVKVKNNVALYKGVECEEDVFLGPNCVFTNVINPRSFIEKKNEFRKTIIYKGATIGANATIICGHKIGKYALIGAGSVVTRDIPAYRLAVGNPARIVGYVCECGEKIYFKNCFAKCDTCLKEYKEEDGMVERI